jgi:hypothetical protein
MLANNEELHFELEKAKEVTRAAVNLFRAGGSIERAVRDAEAIADMAFDKAQRIVDKTKYK